MTLLPSMLSAYTCAHPGRGMASKELVTDERREEVDRGELLRLSLEQPRLEAGGHAGATKLAQGALPFDEVQVGIVS
jgi:hypothetical protein